MKIKNLLCLLAMLLSLTAMASKITSPDGKLTLDFKISADGIPQYSVVYNGRQIICDSHLGFQTKQTPGFESGFGMTSCSIDSIRGSWKPVWGENESISDNYNSMTVSLSNREANTKLNIEFLVYDDGVGLRYLFPKQRHKKLTVIDELTQFSMGSDMTAWWIPGDYDTQEYEYTRSRLSEIRKLNAGHMENVAQQRFSPTGVQTSLMLKTDDGIYVNIHETHTRD